MAKRIADKELTDRNWDQEDEGEEAGTFLVASEDVLKNRAIKKAKRRNIGGEGDGGGGGSFKGFKGFSLTPSAASGGSTAPPTMFSGFGNGDGFKGLSGLANGNSAAPSFGGFSSSVMSTAATPLTSSSSSSSKPPADVITKQTNGSAPSSVGGSSNKEYNRQLTALNCSVRDWITKHVNDNPLCDLNPIFRDYVRHMGTIEREYGSGAAAGAAGAPEEKKKPEEGKASSAPAATASLFSSAKKPAGESGSSSSAAPAAPVPVGVTFNFGQKVDSSALGSLGAKPGFSFSASSSGQSSLFGSSAPAAPLSFGTPKTEEAPPAGENGDEESEEPPVPEVKEVKEKDAFYSKKCKLFYKKESEFKEKGVGTLHLKVTSDGKTQMIIRADTNLGNILLNIMVQSSMPCTRVGKNNVMVVCTPNPPVDEKNPGSPVPLLIRVKTGEDADELHKTLEEKKG